MLSQAYSVVSTKFVLGVIISMCLTGCQSSQSAAQESGKAKKAKTEKNQDKKKHTNRLAKESSPYLLMHAHNPVNWYPWGEEALKKAKDENKPIFLSIGYSSCHWCHVMERESFLDEEIAKLMNENFVCIKIDREERPDIDKIYMTSLYMYRRLSGQPPNGGWPLSMFLTPDSKPFFGGTYFPARDGDRGATVGFLTLVKKVDELWKDQPANIKRDAEIITKATRSELRGFTPSTKVTMDSAWIDAAVKNYKDSYDKEYGGFVGGRVGGPKFPEPSNLFFLLEYVKDKPDDAEAKTALLGTLDRMAMGGIRDHIGGGFHRYSVDPRWEIPHFEKMLYDNGQLATLYAEAFVMTGDQKYKQVVDEMFTFIANEMTSAEGGFYSALDAESESEEGKFYRWEKKEIEAALTADEFKLFSKVYGVDRKPNFEKEYYAPQLYAPFATFAAAEKMPIAELEAKLKPIRKKLFDVRAKRERPLLDTKILTSWNGLMIRGFADAGRLLKNESYIATAEKAANFVAAKLMNKENRLMRTYSNGEAKLNAYLNDYAFLIDGMIALHKATQKEKWLKLATALQNKQDELYWDKAIGGYFFTSTDHEVLIVRSKNPIDGAQPAGNSVSAQNLLYLAKATDNAEFDKKAKLTISSVSALMERSPNSAPRLLIATKRALTKK